ncbi:MAG: FeoA family protein [Mobilicoccus sp.]|nr:FeoA family protein [Mobilicoccus sp.]
MATRPLTSAASSVTIADASHSLAAVPLGGTAVVTGVRAASLDTAGARRLAHLGFVAGARVEVVRRAPLGDPTIYRVADTDIALRRAHAAAVAVASS